MAPNNQAANGQAAGGRAGDGHPGSAGSPPPVSVVIPVYNEAAAVVGAIRSALLQDYAGTVEVVVADGASTDGTPAAIRDVFGDGVRVVANPEGRTPAGLNAAIRASVGDVIVRCDAHSILPPGYISTAVNVMEATGSDVVGGLQRVVGGTAFESAVAAAMVSPMGAGGATYRSGTSPGPADTVYLGVFRRSAFERVGLFDESLVRNQDYELNLRIRSSGGTVYFHPDLDVAYRPRSTPLALWKQYWQYGAWKREVLRRDPSSVRLRQLAAPGLVAALATSIVLAAKRRRTIAMAVPLVYGSALGVAAGRQMRPAGADAAARVAIALATMHLGWGLGFFFGKAPAGRPHVPRLEPK